MHAHDGLSCASVTDGLRYNIGAVWFFLQKRDMEHGQYVLAAKVSENERKSSTRLPLYLNTENTIPTTHIPC